MIGILTLQDFLSANKLAIIDKIGNCKEELDDLHRDVDRISAKFLPAIIVECKLLK
jgi:hypothetical protein